MVSQRFALVVTVLLFVMIRLIGRGVSIVKDSTIVFRCATNDRNERECCMLAATRHTDRRTNETTSENEYKGKVKASESERATLTLQRQGTQIDERTSGQPLLSGARGETKTRLRRV